MTARTSLPGSEPPERRDRPGPGDRPLSPVRRARWSSVSTPVSAPGADALTRWQEAPRGGSAVALAATVPSRGAMGPPIWDGTSKGAPARESTPSLTSAYPASRAESAPCAGRPATGPAAAYLFA
jgi:hypothetical protein